AGAAVVARQTARNVVVPLWKLRATVARLAAGDLAARADATGAGEVRELATWLNELAATTEDLTTSQALRLLDERTLSDMRRRIHSSLDVEAMLPDALAVVAPTLAADRVAVWLEDGDGVLREVATWTEAVARQPDGPMAPMTEHWLHVIKEVVARERYPLIVDDTSAPGAEDDLTAVAFASAGVRAALVCPLRTAVNGSRGVLAVHDVTGPRPWSRYEVALAEAVANEIATAVDHARAYALERESVRRLEDLDLEKTIFVSAVSHELRTPLTSILGYLEMLRDGDQGPLTGEQQAALGIVQRNGQRLASLIDDLLMVARLESRDHGMVVGDVPVAPLLRQAVDALGPGALERGVVLHAAVSDDVGWIRGDAAQLERVMLNLVSNAVKFTPAGGRVDIGACRDQGLVRLTVADTGIGIPLDEQPRLFSRFFRSSNAVAHAAPGTGLGLSIVKKLVDAHHGAISIESVPDVGTTVTVELPVSLST
ncbi:MAG TPA: ATP-binding protein, partial [Acidimicrobiia bacterium]|nr:ATP-binding protein [Acidimicrobiia bacterium]